MSIENGMVQQMEPARLNIPVEPIDMARYLKKILDRTPGLTIKELAFMIEKTPDWIEEHLSLLLPNKD